MNAQKDEKAIRLILPLDEYRRVRAAAGVACCSMSALASCAVVDRADRILREAEERKKGGNGKKVESEPVEKQEVTSSQENSREEPKRKG